jgi:outer membrane protein assembly factor BamB
MKKICIITILFPPLGLVLLWRSNQVDLRRKLTSTAGLAIYSGIYAGAVVALLMCFTGLELEWRGGFPPVLTWRKSHPDYDAVEASRRAQSNKPAPPDTSDARVVWPGFRGLHRDGHYDEKPVATNWPAAGLRPLWKQPIGGGYASFAIAGGRAFTIEQRRGQEVVTAYSVDSGRELWASAYAADFNESMGGEGPRATPFFSEGKVYSLGAMGDLLCLDAASGQVIW